MKALGMTQNLVVVTPSRVEDKIWDAVQDAIVAGWTPEQFKREVAEAWQQELRDASRHAARVLSA